MISLKSNSLGLATCILKHQLIAASRFSKSRRWSRWWPIPSRQCTVGWDCICSRCCIDRHWRPSDIPIHRWLRRGWCIRSYHRCLRHRRAPTRRLCRPRICQCRLAELPTSCTLLRSGRQECKRRGPAHRLLRWRIGRRRPKWQKLIKGILFFGGPSSKIFEQSQQNIVFNQIILIPPILINVRFYNRNQQIILISILFI